MLVVVLYLGLKEEDEKFIYFELLKSVDNIIFRLNRFTCKIQNNNLLIHFQCCFTVVKCNKFTFPE